MSSWTGTVEFLDASDTVVGSATVSLRERTGRGGLTAWKATLRDPTRVVLTHLEECFEKGTQVRLRREDGTVGIALVSKVQRGRAGSRIELTAPILETACISTGFLPSGKGLRGFSWASRDQLIRKTPGRRVAMVLPGTGRDGLRGLITSRR